MQLKYFKTIFQYYIRYISYGINKYLIDINNL